MSFTQSLKKNYQFRNVYNKGKSIANKHLVAFALKNNTCVHRLGISVSKKVGISVVRNRVTRLIRESYRLNEFKLTVPDENSGMDIVFIARVNAKTASYDEISRSMLHLLKKHGIA